MGTHIAGPAVWTLVFVSTPLALLLLFTHMPRWSAAVARLMGRIPRLWRQESASGPPLERLAADLRRLYPDAHHPRQGLRMPKQRGILLAYDKRLCDTAARLGVATDLDQLPVAGFEREAERLRVEHALAEAGVVWQVQPGPWRADPAA